VINEDGSLIAVGSGAAEVIMVHDGATGRHLVDVAAPAPPEGSAAVVDDTVALAFHPDGTLVLGSPAGSIRIVDPITGTELRRLDAPPFAADRLIFISDDGHDLITVGSGASSTGAGSTDALVAGFDLESGTPLWPAHPVSTDRCSDVAYAERLDALLCSHWSGEIVTTDITTGAPTTRVFSAQQGGACGLAVSADGRRLAHLAACADGAVTVVEWSLDGGGAISRLIVDQTHQRWLQQYGFAGDDTALIADWFSADGTPVSHAIDTSTGDVIDQFPGVLGMIPTDEPDTVVAVFDDDGTIGRYDVTRHTPIGPRVDPGFEISSLWTNGERVIVATWAEQRFRLQGIDLDTGTLVGPEIDTDQFEIFQVAFTADAMYTETFPEFRVERRDLDTGELMSEPAEGFKAPATGGGILVANTTGGRILELDPITLEPVGLPFPGVTGPVARLALDDNGRRMMAVGDDGNLRIYDVATRTQLGDPIDLDEPSPGEGTAIRGDGLQVAAAVGQGFAVWDLDPTRWIEAACQLAGRNLTRAEWDQYIGDLAPYRPTCTAHPADTST
jgi:WD40 repeat protein